MIKVSRALSSTCSITYLSITFCLFKHCTCTWVLMRVLEYYIVLRLQYWSIIMSSWALLISYWFTSLRTVRRVLHSSTWSIAPTLEYRCETWSVINSSRASPYCLEHSSSLIQCYATSIQVHPYSYGKDSLPIITKLFAQCRSRTFSNCPRICTNKSYSYV